MSDKRLVAICDILGFKDLIMTRPLSEVVDKHYDLLGSLLHPADKPSLEERGVGLARFSDTVLLYTIRDDESACQALIEEAATLLCMTVAYINHIPLRIGVDYGELYVCADGHVYLGRAIVEAHFLESAQNWAGGALTTAAARRVSSEWLCSYEVPMKQSCPEEIRTSVALDWTKHLHLRTGLTSYLTTEGTGTPVRSKWRNTALFHKSQCPNPHCD